MKNLLILTITLLFSTSIFSQTSEKASQKGKWFFGVELGLNTITSIHPEQPNSLQGGVLAEYYFAKQWSLNARIKYLKTGVSHQNETIRAIFEGAIVSIPLNIKWEYRITPKLNGNLKLGMALNQEVKSEYDYPEHAPTDYDTFYTCINPGLGLNYFISPNTAIYVNYEVYVLGNDRGDSNFNWIRIIPNSPENNLINVGIKHCFK